MKNMIYTFISMLLMAGLCQAQGRNAVNAAIKDHVQTQASSNAEPRSEQPVPCIPVPKEEVAKPNVSINITIKHLHRYVKKVSGQCC